MSTRNGVQQFDIRRRWPLARLLSLALVALAVAVVLGFFWFGGLFAPEESPPPPEVVKQLEAYDKALSITRSIVIKGRDDKGRPYLITASRSRRDETRKDITQLFDVAGSLHQSNGATIFFRADRADVHRRTNDVTLLGKVLIRKKDGWRLRTEEVRVNSKTRDMMSDRPVVVRMNDTLIHARGIAVRKEGDVVRFKGPVRARFNERGEENASTGNGKGENGGEESRP